MAQPANTIICSNCQTPNPTTGKFCLRCGTNLSMSSTPSYSPLTTTPNNVLQMGGSTGTGCLGPFAGKGTQVDAWADIVEGMSAQAPAVTRAFDQHIQGKDIPNADIRTEQLTAPGFAAEKRIYYMVRRVPALVSVYIAGLGADLYVSWRLFVKAPISWFRIIAWLATATFFALPNLLIGFTMGLGFGYGRNPLEMITPFIVGLGSFLVSILINASILTIIAAVIGYWLGHDPTYLWRVPLNEFHEDDIAALELSVHKALLGSVDAVGIDSKLLRIKEKFGVSRGRVI